MLSVITCGIMSVFIPFLSLKESLLAKWLPSEWYFVQCGPQRKIPRAHHKFWPDLGPVGQALWGVGGREGK